MSQAPPGQGLTTPSRTRASHHKAFGPFSHLMKPERSQSSLRSAFSHFKRMKKQELLLEDPSLTQEAIAQAVREAWTQLTPAQRKSIPPKEVTPNRIPAKPESQPASDFEEAETGQSESTALENPPGLFTRLGRVLKSAASYFLVRPF